MNFSTPFNPIKCIGPIPPPRTQRLRVRASASLDGGWSYTVADYESRLPLARDFGPLPLGFTFNTDTARLFALAQAARRVARDYPGAVVCLVNTATAREPRRESRERRAA